MMTRIATCLALLSLGTACGATKPGPNPTKAENEAKSEPKAEAKSRKSDTTSAKPAPAATPAPGEPEVPKRGPAVGVRPQGVPPDWQQVSHETNNWSFWVPGDWEVEPTRTAADEDLGDKETHPPMPEGSLQGPPITCYTLSPGFSVDSDKLKKQALERAKSDAKGHKVEVRAVGEQAFELEYNAQGDGTKVIERWAPNATGGMALVCFDETGSAFAQTRQTAETILKSFQ